MPRNKNTITKSFTYKGKRYYVSAQNEADIKEKIALKKKSVDKEIKAEKLKLEQRKVSMTVKEWAYEAVTTYKVSQKPITQKKYIERMETTILSQIGKRTLTSITPMDCQKILNKQVGKSKTQINEVAQTLKFIFKMAKVNKLIDEDPTVDIIKPKGNSTPRRSLTDYERQHFLSVAERFPKFIIFRLMLECGCRPSEAREVKGSDIRLVKERPMLHIRGSKTENADRLVPIPDALYEKLKDVAAEDYVCTNHAGKHYDESSYKRICWALYRELNLSMGCKTYRNKLQPPYPLADDLVPYCFRHTYCTDMLRKGVDLRIVQYLMGHATIEMTAHYTHVDEEMAYKAVQHFLNSEQHLNRSEQQSEQHF